MYKFYKNNITPLKEVELFDLKITELFVNSEGVRYEYLGEGAFITDRDSELEENETLEGFDDHHLDLFWTLMRHKLWI
jgi:hypothetical protein